MEIDTTFDFRTDTPPGKDPDRYSPTLRKYHKYLWSKYLPNGSLFKLGDNTPSVYLHHKSEIGEFFLSSDAVVPFFSRENKIVHITSQIPTAEIDEYNRIGYTIGGMMLFPGNRIGKHMTINGARGFHPKIKDRFDLTVECIRRHYLKQENPLKRTLNRYDDFFILFNDFKGFMDFFLLQDLVDSNYSQINYFYPFEGFDKSPIPHTKEAYISYANCAVDFILKRNQRIINTHLNSSPH
jgi:hypothetical protein